MIELVAFIFGFTIYMILSAPETGAPNRFDELVGFSTSLHFKIPFSTFKIHIHHWLYLSIIRLFVSNVPLIWFCHGGILQGIIMYRDFYRIIY